MGEIGPIAVYGGVMNRRIFEDDLGRVWKVTKLGSALFVEGDRYEHEKLVDVARSCALKAGIKQTRSGIPLEYVNEHRRIWHAIWNTGKPSL